MLIRWSDRAIRMTKWARWLKQLNSVALEEAIKRGSSPGYRVKIVKRYSRLYELVDPVDGFVLARAKKKRIIVKVCNQLGWEHCNVIRRRENE